MTGKEIINKIKPILEELSYPSAVAYLTLNDKKWLKATIKALEQEPCDDVVSRQAVLDKKELVELEDGQSFYCISPEDVDTLPPVNPTKTGHWIRWYEQKEYDGVVDHIPHCKCSECGKEYDPHSSQFIKYCNECGARMIEPQERSGEE